MYTQVRTPNQKERTECGHLANLKLSYKAHTAPLYYIDNQYSYSCGASSHRRVNPPKIFIIKGCVQCIALVRILSNFPIVFFIRYELSHRDSVIQ